MNLDKFLKIIALSLLWGPMFLYVNVAVKEIPPLTLGASRFLLAAIILLAILKFQGGSLPRDRATWKHFVISGLTHNALPFTIASWGMQYIDSVLAAILFATTPLFTMLMARLMRTGEQLGYGKFVGVTIGFGGIITLLLPGLSSGFELTLWGMLAVIGSAVSVGSGLVYTQKNLSGQPPLVATTGQIITSLLFLLPLSLLIDKPYTMSLPSMTALGALLLLAVLSTVVAFIVYFRVMNSVSATDMSLTAYLNPVISAVLGVLILGESFGPLTAIGSGLILFGAAIVNGLRIPRLIPNPEACQNPTAPIPC